LGELQRNDIEGPSLVELLSLLRSSLVIFGPSPKSPALEFLLAIDVHDDHRLGRANYPRHVCHCE
jgi:hypothetical protein